MIVFKKDSFICGEEDGWERKDVGLYGNVIEFYGFIFW